MCAKDLHTFVYNSRDVSLMKSAVRKETHKNFLNNLVEEITQKEFCGVSLVSFLGSESENNITEFSDLDVLIILDNPPPDDPTNSRSYFRLVSILKDIQERFNKKGIHFCIFPTHRVEEFTRKFAYVEYASKHSLIHLLVYPSLKSFVSWELPNIVESICATGEIIFGNKSILKNAQRQVESLDFKQRIEPLLSCLYEAYRYLECSQISDPVIRMEAFHMLEYVVKYLSGEVLRSKGYNIHKIFSWGTIIHHKSEIADSVGLIDSIYNRRKDRVQLSIRELRSLYIQAFNLFNTVLTRTASVVTQACE